jgi:hypothetical protein
LRLIWFSVSQRAAESKEIIETDHGSSAGKGREGSGHPYLVMNGKCTRLPNKETQMSLSGKKKSGDKELAHEET